MANNVLIVAERGTEGLSNFVEARKEQIAEIEEELDKLESDLKSVGR